MKFCGSLSYSSLRALVPSESELSYTLFFFCICFFLRRLDDLERGTAAFVEVFLRTGFNISYTFCAYSSKTFSFIFLAPFRKTGLIFIIPLLEAGPLMNSYICFSKMV